MSQVTVELNDLISALSSGTNRDLGNVLLRVSNVLVNETVQPALPITTPVVMTDFAMVPSDSYKFFYSQSRFLKIYYILERDVKWEMGELLILNTSPIVTEESQTPPSESGSTLPPADPVPPTVLLRRNILMWTSEDTDAGALGVDLAIIPDPTTTNKGMMFGIAYKITNATPAIFPTIHAAIALEMPAVIPPPT